MNLVRTTWSATLAAGAAFALAAATLPAVSSAAAEEREDDAQGGVIVWTNRADDGSEHLVIARADGTHQRQLTAAAPDTADIDAQISPHGQWVAYEHDDAFGPTVRLVRPDGTDDHAFTGSCVDPCVGTASPTWLTDDRLAFVRLIGPFGTGVPASAVLWTSRLDGSDLRRLSPPGIDGRYEDSRAHLSADRSYLTFERLRDEDFRTAIFRMAPDGSHVRRLTPWGISADLSDLSTARRGPTRNLVVFDSYGRGNENLTFIDLGTVPATCTSLRNCRSRIRWLTDNAASGRRNANPQWSPDGSSLVFTDRSGIDNPNAEIWTMRYRGGDRRKISTSPNFDYRPTWGTIDD